MDLAFWQRVWDLFMTAPVLVIAIAVIFALGGWLFRGFQHREAITVHKDKEGVFNQRLTLATEKQADLTSKLALAESEVLKLQSQIVAGAVREQLALTAASSVSLFEDATSANAALQTTLSTHTLMGSPPALTGAMPVYKITDSSDK